MDLPENLLLQKVKVQYAYCDRKSKEVTTGIVKTKYKLAGNIIDSLKIYTFFIATKNELACQSRLTIEIQTKHWEELEPGHLSNPIGYIDITKFEPLTEQELLYKMRDKGNGFICVAKLCDNKFSELKDLRSKAHTSRSFIPIERTVLIKLALDDIVDFSQISDDLLKKLGLN